jgi:hypothetical protein
MRRGGAAAECKLGSTVQSQRYADRAGGADPIGQEAEMHKIVIAPVFACGLLCATILLAAPSSATSCHSASCVPNVAQNVVVGTPCTPRASFVFGLDAQNATVICSASGVWVPTGPLVGEAQVALPCSTPGTTAQQRLAGNDLQIKTPGVPLQCVGPAGIAKWTHFVVPA